MNTQGAFYVLNTNKKNLTKQQYRTIKGQILSGDIEGAMKGLQRLTKNRIDYSKNKSHYVS